MLSGLGYGQTKDRELAYLRNVLGLERTTPISVAKSLSLPSNSPLRVFISTNTETKVRENFLEWIGSWNRVDGSRFGMIDVVNDKAAAQIFLVRYAYPAPVPIIEEPPESMATPQGIDPATRKPETSGRNPLIKKFKLPIYSYIGLYGEDGLMIIRNYSDSVVVSSIMMYTNVTPDSSSANMDMNGMINNGNTPMKGQRDSKLAGDRLRDEFFKLIKARPGKK